MSTITRTLRYHLPEKAIKSDCPECGPKHRKTLSRYVDFRTGETLPEIYGKCDRASNCGYYLSPYQKGASGMSYADEVYQIWREEQQGLKPRPLTNTKSTTITAKQIFVPVIYSLSNEVFTASLGHYDRNNFATLLVDHFGSGVAADMLIRFQIGTSSHWPGACVFWLKDERNRVRGGQVVLFDETGHTAKRPLPDGTEKRCTNWVHYALASRYDRKKEPHPEWLTTYINKSEKFPIPFGLHQLATSQPDQAVAIVESPKTSIVCSAHLPEFVWMAIGGLTYLSRERLAPLRSRKLVLFPDVSTNGRAFELWNNRAVQLRENGFVVTVSDYLEQRATDQEKADGLDLADYLLNQWKGYPPDWDNLLTAEITPTLSMQSLANYIQNQ